MKTVLKTALIVFLVLCAIGRLAEYSDANRWQAFRHAVVTEDPRMLALLSAIETDGDDAAQRARKLDLAMDAYARMGDPQ